MMAGVDKEIAEYLEDQSVGTVGTNIFVGNLPPTTVSAYQLTAYAGRPQDKSCAIEYPHLQVLYRTSDAAGQYSVGYTAIMTVKTKLQRLGDTTIEGTRYLSIYALQSAPNYLGRDDEGRHLFTMNFEITKEV